MAGFWERLGNYITDIRVERLIVRLRDQNYEAAEALGRIGDARAVEPLIAALRNIYSSDVHRAAAEALGQIGDARAVGPLISALGEKDSDVRETAAAAALVKIGLPAVEPLIAALRSVSSIVQQTAEEALDKIEPDWRQSEAAQQQVPDFIAALRDRDSGPE